MATLDDKLLSLTPGSEVHLFDVDLTELGGSILRFTPNREELIPATVTRLSDVSTTVATSRIMTIPATLSEGDEVIIDGYIRRGESLDSYPALGISGVAGGSAPFVRRLLNLSTGSVLTTSNTPGGVASSQAFTLSQAGEFHYFSWRITIPAGLPTLYFVVYPAYGLSSGFNTSTDVVAVGTVDMFGLRVRRRAGGGYIPVVLPVDIAGSFSLATTVPNTAQALKVPVWGGNAYTPIPIEASGYEKSGNGPFPRPKLRMSNLFNEGAALAQEFGDMRGAVVTRRRVFSENLDNGADPDPAASYPPDVFRVDRKAMQNSQVIEWELASVLDQQGIGLPGREILRDACPFAYRVWNGTSWVYSAEDGCPYTGSAMYDEQGNTVTDPAEDKCSHRLKTGCRARYGRSVEVPFGAFAMVGRLGS